MNGPVDFDRDSEPTIVSVVRVAPAAPLPAVKVGDYVRFGAWVGRVYRVWTDACGFRRAWASNPFGKSHLLASSFELMPYAGPEIAVIYTAKSQS